MNDHKSKRERKQHKLEKLRVRRAVRRNGQAKGLPGSGAKATRSRRFQEE